MIGKVTSGLDAITAIAKGGVQPSQDGTAQLDGAAEDHGDDQDADRDQPGRHAVVRRRRPSSTPAS